MNEHIKTRLAAIQQSLIAHYKGGSGLPTAVIGSERENIINDYLSEVLPPIYRFGRGAITDSNNVICGQIEVVMELPFAPNFPMPLGKERLYLAEAVAAVIEVKSNLSSQWQEVIATTYKIKKLTRDLCLIPLLSIVPSPDPILNVEDSSKIPVYAVGYTGYQTLDSLRGRLSSTPIEYRPDGALVIDSGCFIGLSGASTGVWGLYALIAELVAHVNEVLGLAYPNILAYGDIERNK